MVRSNARRKRRHPVVCVVACACLALTVGTALVPAAAVAQPVIEEASLSESEREKQFEELARDVSTLERHAHLLKQVVKLTRPTVVHIEVFNNGRKRRAADDPPDETGSGVIFNYDQRHYVLTNRHLIRSAELDGITIALADGREIKPTRKWADKGTDVAVMAVPSNRLIAAHIGNSDEAEIGDFVLAIGSPFGLHHSVTFGIISAKGRRDLELATDPNEGISYQNFMQIDASINPGNSGGPLVNLQGEVIGINTAIASTTGRNEGIGFTIPINMAMIVAKQMIDHGVVTRGFLGVNLDARFGAAAAAQLGLDRPRGARITSVTKSSPAEQGDLRVGDVVLRFNENWIENDSDLVNRVSLTQVGKDVPVLVLRDGKTVELTVKVGNRSDFR